MNRNYQVRTIVMFLFLCVYSAADAQQQQIILGRTINSETKMPVSYAMIANSGSGQNTFTDSLGYFSIKAGAGDTLVISRLGFSTNEIHITHIILNQKKIIPFELNPRSYDLKEVTISSLGTYQQFKYNVINSELPKSEYEVNPHIMKPSSKDIIIIDPQARISLGSPVTAIYMLVSKEGKSLRKLAKEEAKDKEIASYSHKYSPKIVSELTGLKDLELEKFMKYCNLDPNFIKQAMEYDIAEKILACFKNYNAENEAKTQSSPEEN